MSCVSGGVFAILVFPASTDGVFSGVASLSVQLPFLSHPPYYQVTGFPCCYFRCILRDISRDWNGLGDLDLGSDSVVQHFLLSVSVTFTCKLGLIIYFYLS